MPQSSRRLRLRDLRAIYRLIGECRDLGCYPVAWHAHLLQNLCELVGGGAAAITEVVRGGEHMKVLASMGAGWPDPQTEKLWLKFTSGEDPAHDPFYEHTAQLLGQPGGVLTRPRRQLAAATPWQSTEHPGGCRGPAASGDSLHSFNYVPCEDGPRMNCLEVSRDSNDQLFTARETRLLHWLHYELGPLLGRQLAWLDEPTPSNLAPRHRQTLQCLLEGDTERQAAVKMGVSKSTVHEYVMAVYRHFAVSSRAELLARFLRHRIAPNPAIKDFADAFRLRRKPEE